MKTALVTGASGFVGKALCESLVRQGVRVHAVVRDVRKAPEKTYPVCINDIRESIDWEPRLKGVDIVFHLAGLAHRIKSGREDLNYEFGMMHASNVDPTRRLAQAAEKAGVKRLVYVSSVKVNGERTQGKPFCEKDPPDPEDAYGMSKLAVEQDLRDFKIETVVVRSPLVYGEGVKGNFYSLLKLCDTPWPLPFSCIGNQRSLIYLKNLVDALCLCATHPKAANRTFLVRDGKDTMTSDLVRNMRRALRRVVRLFPLPAPVLKALFWLVGRSSAWDRLSGSLQIDDSEIRKLLGWEPPFSFDTGLKNTVNWYRNTQGVR